MESIAPIDTKALFNDLIEQHSDYFLSYALLKVDSRQDAEDLVQEMFLSGFKSYDSFENKSGIKTWLISILRNKISDFYRSKSRVPSISNYLSETEDSINEGFFNKGDYGSWENKITENYSSSSSDEYLIGKEFRELLSKCVEKLPLKLRGVFVAKYLKDKNSKEVCKEFDITPSNYWTMVFRSKLILRSCLMLKGITLD